MAEGRAEFGIGLQTVANSAADPSYSKTLQLRAEFGIRLQTVAKLGGGSFKLQNITYTFTDRRNIFFC